MVEYIILQGIPIIYYGTEQAFHGGGDPLNRESLWPHGKANTSLYQVGKKQTCTR